MSARTPGPWFFEANTGRIVSADGATLAFASSAHESSLSNGLMLAAAPDLLDIASKAADTFAEFEKTFGLFGFPKAAEAAAIAEKATRAAIAKATGEAA